MGAALDGLLLDDVLSAFEKACATGPAAFTGCSFTEATFTDCDLADAEFSECTLRLTEFGAGRYRDLDLDLRGNDLSGIRGVAALSKILTNPTQQADLAQALVTDLDITLEDD
ncbi:pentapeptide repeat-containing protein [Streptomyces sp. NPDC101206]|uniref:pentapeptide repeat-containing protein n=1 Tax=Streptomyces sp. NPDC101206 TaxID=3366128 RepID=UPI00382B7030